MTERAGPKGTIIFLNGVSSTGKTTLTRALQNILPERYYWLSNDVFCDMHPKQFWDKDESESIYESQIMMHHTAKLFSDLGRCSIIDQVVLPHVMGSLFPDTLELFRDNPVLLVRVTCPQEELERRERERGDRRVGQAVEQLSLLHPQSDADYDMVVDTFTQGTEACAAQIAAAAARPEEFRAMERLRGT